MRPLGPWARAYTWHEPGAVGGCVGGLVCGLVGAKHRTALYQGCGKNPFFLSRPRKGPARGPRSARGCSTRRPPRPRRTARRAYAGSRRKPRCTFDDGPPNLRVFVIYGAFLIRIFVIEGACLVQILIKMRVFTSNYTSTKDRNQKF